MTSRALGRPTHQRLRVITSACHGVEGFCGSGLQTALIRDLSLSTHRRASSRRRGVVRARAQPLGVSWWRRTERTKRRPQPQLATRSASPCPQRRLRRNCPCHSCPRHLAAGAENEAVLAAFAERHGSVRCRSHHRGNIPCSTGALFGAATRPEQPDSAPRASGTRKPVQRLAWIDIHHRLGPTVTLN
jgi:hypothetical protein